MHVYDISLNSSRNKRCFRRNCGENESKYFITNKIYSPKIVPFVK